MSGEKMQHFASFFFAVGFDAMSENDLVAGLVHTLLERKAALLGLLQSPSSGNSRDLSDILLTVSAVYRERVQFLSSRPQFSFKPLRLPLACFTTGGRYLERRRLRLGIPFAISEFGPTLSQLSR